eukprot:8748195-Alexandrium_andersonii.AAC.1
MLSKWQLPLGACGMHSAGRSASDDRNTRHRVWHSVSIPLPVRSPIPPLHTHPLSLLPALRCGLVSPFLF